MYEDSWPDKASVSHAPLSTKAHDVLQALLGYLSQFSPEKRTTVSEDPERSNTFLITICGTSILVAVTNEFIEIEDADSLEEVLDEVYMLAETSIPAARSDNVITLDRTGVGLIRR